MKTTYKHTPWKVIAAMTAVISGLLYAVAVFDPVSQPTVTLGEYALKSRDLLDGPTKAYRSWFENGAWQGDLIEYDINIDGSRSLDHTLTGYTHTTLVGSNDDTALIALASDSTKTWMARATFLKKEQDITDYWKEETTNGRRLFTYNNSTQVSFLWDNLTAAQKTSLDPETINDPNGDGDPADKVDPASSQNDNYFGPVFNFIRGDRSKETDQTDGFLRKRYSLLGDITNTPVYLGPPRELFSSYHGYAGFRYANRNRTGMVATPANDGILHFFAEADGSEIMGYIPSMVIEDLFQLALPAYQHTYYLDGEMAVSSAQLDPDHGNCVDSVDTNKDPINVSACEWHTVLAGGGGAGFEGLFALDVTTPGYSSDKVLFEKTGGDFGHIYGAPRIAALGTAAAPDWYVFTGSGYKTACTGIKKSDCDTDTSHPAALLMVSLADPNTVHSIDTSANGGLSSPVLVNTDETDLPVEVAFAGDINGDLWMFRLDKADPANSTALKVFDGVPNLPISNTPAIVKHPDTSIGGYIVYFGTGSIFSQVDALNDAIDTNGDSLFKQAIYGIHIKQSWIDGTDTSFDPLEDGDLQTQALNPVDPPITAYFANNNETKVVRTTPVIKPVNYYCNIDDDACAAALFKGWRLEFPICGERLVGAPFVRAKRVQFITTNPTGLQCGKRTLAGDSWMMSLDYLTGASANKVAFNLNGDNKLDVLDTASGVPPVGLSLGEGNIAQPAFVRLKDGIDKMFVNGIILPLPPITNPGPLIFGHLDVITDSPAGGVTAPNLISKHSAGYQNNVNDGLSQSVDGLFHDYDTTNGISYVDLFELEPRRGLASLSPTSDSTNAASNVCSSTDDDKRILANGKCIEAVEAELNRAYDTLTRSMHTLETPDVVNGEKVCPEDEGRFGPFYRAIINAIDGTIEECEKTVIVPESETYKLDGAGGELLADDKQFMVVLANADLSELGSLQIGCKVWKGGLNNATPKVNEFIQYQDHIAKQLELGVAPDKILDPKYNEPVIFTLESIANNTDLNGDPLSWVCPENSKNPTLRVLFDEDAILRKGVHGTRAQCVLGLHEPTVKVCYSDPEVLAAADSAARDTRALIDDPAIDLYDDLSCATVPPTPVPPSRYIKDPELGLHITAETDNGFAGYRWRNGALTVQLLDPATMVLQDPGDLPHKGTTRKGGTFAKAFDNVVSVKKKSDTFTYFDKYIDVNESGLLYEAAIFWHYSDLADNIQRADTASIPCYGASNYGSALTQEERGLTEGQYKVWADALEGEKILADFAALLNTINSATSEAVLNQALLDLDALYADALLGDILREYAQYRDYVPGSVIPEQHLLDIDKNLADGGNTNSSTADAVPANVITIETIDLESLGPNAVLGQRNWIDLRQ